MHPAFASPRKLALALSLGMAGWSAGQCGNDNLQAGSAVSPACPGTTSIPCVQGGQYALVNVVAGNTYTFSTCGASFDTQITLYNNTGGGSLGYNDDACGLQSTVTWTATFTGQLRVVVDAYFCATNATCAPLAITCAAPPVGDCVYTLTLSDAFSDGWGTSYVGVSINGGAYVNYTLATGLASTTIQIGVDIGDVVLLNYNASGTWQTDNSYILALGGGTLFNSGSPPVAGAVYAGVVTCTPPPPQQEDCLGATTICSYVAISNNTTNTGNVVDISASNSGCLDIVEYQGTWYAFSPSAGGNLGFTIAPLGPDDYDWAVWGPYPPGSTPSSICPPAGPPIRCAASSGPATFSSTGSYATGMGHATFSPPQFASTAITYGLPATLNTCPLVPPQYCGWVPGMQVTTGQVYLLYVSNWSQSSTGFNLSWNLQNGASLECTVLPVELLAFQAWPEAQGVRLRWTTSTELNNDRFEVERSTDAVDFVHIGTVPGAGTSLEALHYTTFDPFPHAGMNYYRLRQVDHNGDHAYSPVRAVHMQGSGSAVQLVPNPGSGLVDVRCDQLDPGATLVLRDAIGRDVFRVRLNAMRTTLDLSWLPAGLYGYRVLSAAGVPLANGTWMRE